MPQDRLAARTLVWVVGLARPFTGQDTHQQRPRHNDGQATQRHQGPERGVAQASCRRGVPRHHVAFNRDGAVTTGIQTRRRTRGETAGVFEAMAQILGAASPGRITPPGLSTIVKREPAGAGPAAGRDRPRPGARQPAWPPDARSNVRTGLALWAINRPQCGQRAAPPTRQRTPSRRHMAAIMAVAVHRGQ